MPNKPTLLGTVQDVQGATISVAMDKDTVSGLSFIDGQGYRVGQIGSFVRIPIGFIDLYGIVSQVGAGAVPDSMVETEPHGHRWIRIQLIGEGQRGGNFNRGVSYYPTIGDEAHLLTEQDLTLIYGRADAPNYVRVGNLASAESIPALVDADRLVTRHSAVLGATGAGKSTTVAGILSHLSNTSRYPSSRIIIFDLHGEYNAALGERATLFRVNPNLEKGEKPLLIPYWALQFDELLGVTPFRDVGDTERSGLIEKINELKRASLATCPRAGVTSDTLTVDSPVPFSIHRLWYELYQFVCSTHTAQGANQSQATEAIEVDPQGNQLLGNIMGVQSPKYRPITSGGAGRIYLSGAALNIRRQIQALQSLLRDTRYDFLFRPGDWCPSPDLNNLDVQPQKDLDALIKDWVGGDKPITILDLSGVPASILMDLIGVLIRLLFDAMVWGRFLPVGARSRPLLFVLEEAHAYLNPGNKSLASQAARRVVKEGRKYGLGAMIVSQRPSEIDSTILSQCGTMFAMRLANSSDRAHVTGTVSDNLEGLLSMLPALRTGEAIIVGEAVQLPLRAQIEPPPPHRRPDSHDPKIYDPQAQVGWNTTKRDEDYSLLVQKWRSETP